MFIALDQQGNRVHADDAVKTDNYICQKCGKEVKPKQGIINKWHFAHITDEGCDYGRDGDYKSKWHIRMQEYFPEDSREYRFKDHKTGEVHIADVYVESSNTVLEFQKSRITEEEFLKRTWFHIKKGRRIVWLFDESTDKEKDGYIGKFKFIKNMGPEEYKKAWYRWSGKPRKQLVNGPDIVYSNEFYSICIYTGEEGDSFHRVLNSTIEFDEVALSDKVITLEKSNCVEQMFESEGYWDSLRIYRKTNVDFIELKKQHQIILKEVNCPKLYTLKSYGIKLGQTKYHNFIIMDYDYLNNDLLVKDEYTDKRYTVHIDEYRKQIKRELLKAY